MFCHDNRQGAGDRERLWTVAAGERQRALKYRQGGAAPDLEAGGQAQRSCRNEEQEADTGCLH